MKTVKCPQCNLVNFNTAINCKRCGQFFQEVEMTQPSAPIQNTVAAHLQPVLPTPSPTPNYSRPTYQPTNYQSSQSSPFVKKGLAIFSMLLGILSFPMINIIVVGLLSVIFAMIFGVTGMIVGGVIGLLILPTGLFTGIVALVKVKRRPNEYGGKGFAITGIVLSGFGLVTIPIVAAIAIPNLFAARKSANEGSAISSMKTIAFAQQKFANMHIRCGDLIELVPNNFLDAETAKGVKSGYIFSITKTANGCEIIAKPAVEDGMMASGSRSFYYAVDEGKLHFSKVKGQLANRSSEIIDTQGFPPVFSFYSQEQANKALSTIPTPTFTPMTMPSFDPQKAY